MRKYSAVTWYDQDGDETSCSGLKGVSLDRTLLYHQGNQSAEVTSELRENPVLVAVPCVMLFLSIPYIINTRPPSSYSVGQCLLSAMKTILSVLLGLLAIQATIKHQESSSDIFWYDTLTMAYTFRAVSMLLAGLVQHVHNQSSFKPLVIYWSMSLLAALAFYRSNGSMSYHKGDSTSSSNAHIALVLVQLVFSCLSKIKREDVKETGRPHATDSIISNITFGWFTSLVKAGYETVLKEEDLWPMKQQDQCSTISPKFEEVVDKYYRTSEPAGGTTGKPTTETETFYKPSLLKPLIHTFGLRWMTLCLIRMIPQLLDFVGPMVLNELITFTNKKEAPMWRGYALAILLCLVSIGKNLVTEHSIFRLRIVAIQMSSVLSSMIYKKALRLSSAARRTTNVGEILNLMSVDAKRFEMVANFLGDIWAMPIQLCLSFYFLWTLLGPSALAGVAVMILLIPVNSICSKKRRSLHQTLKKYKDSRLELVYEVLNVIKVLKLYAWEKSFHEKIQGNRNMELEVKKQESHVDAVYCIFWQCSQILVSLSTFTIYVMSSSDNAMDAQKVFVSMALFNILQKPISIMPKLITKLIEVNVSLERLQEFFTKEELDDANVKHVTSGGNALSIENGTFHWQKETTRPILKSINFKVKEGSLVAIVGAIGSGKSSLLSAILGEMQKEHGTVKVKGTIAYVAQQPWIQNATLKDNILFHKEEDRTEYPKVIEACALSADLRVLSAGDKTEIGEKGINLSGGQKHRVSLARAVYSDSDVYLLDDPLSAVDAHVGKHIFEKVISPNGLLQRKTRVLVTHAVYCLPLVDHIIVLKDGCISEMGTYKELLQNRGAFAEFLTNHAGIQEDKEEDQLQDVSTNHQYSEQIISEEKKVKDSDGCNEECSEVNPAIDRLIQAEATGNGTGLFYNMSIYVQSVGVGIVSLVVLLQVLQKVVSIGADIWISDWTNAVKQSNSTDGKQVKLAIYGFFGLTKAALVSGMAVIVTIGSMNASRQIHADLLMNCFRAPMSFFDTTPIGRIVKHFSKDLDSIDSDIPNSMNDMIAVTCSLLSTVFIMAYSSPLLILALMPLGGIYILLQRFYGATSRQIKRLMSTTNSPLFSHFGETLRGASTIRAYAQSQHFIQQFEKYIEANDTCGYNNMISHRWLCIRVESMGGMLIFLACVFSVFNRAQLSAGLVGLSFSYAIDLILILRNTVYIMTHIENHIVAMERVTEYLGMEMEAPWVNETKRPAPSWPDAGSVSFNNYSTRYRKGLDLVLKGITCDITSGQRVGIVGRTGAGKSSLTLGLFRIIEPAAGTITIDGIDISEIGLHDLRSQITIIPQDPVLFSGTLRMNLDPFDAHTTTQLWTALENAYLKCYVEGLSGKLNHEISEGGENLSVGQRQLVCLARALLRKTKLLVLDEATAAVDLDTDQLIQETIRTEFADCTILTIAHRLNTILDYDKILVFDNGRIAEFAPPEELLANRSSQFYGMAKDAGLTEFH